MATTEKELKSIVIAIEKQTGEIHALNKRLKCIELALQFKEFDTTPPPPEGSVYMNLIGLVCMNKADYEKNFNDKKGEPIG